MIREVTMVMRIRPEDGRAFADMAARTAETHRSTGGVASNLGHAGSGAARAAAAMMQLRGLTGAAAADADRMKVSMEGFARAANASLIAFQRMKALAGGGMGGGGLIGGPAMLTAAGARGPLLLTGPAGASGAGAAGTTTDNGLTLRGLATLAAVQTLVQGVRQGVREGLRTSADQQIEDTMQRDAERGGWWDRVRYSFSRWSRNTIGLDIATDVGSAGPRFEAANAIRVSEARLEQQNRDRARGLALGNENVQRASLAEQLRSTLFGLETDRNANRFAATDRIASLNHYFAEQRTFSGLSSSQATDLQNSAAFRAAMTNFTNELANRTPTNQEALFRINRGQVDGLASLQASESMRLRANRMTVNQNDQAAAAERAELIAGADDLRARSLQRFMELERQRTELVRQSSQAEQERLLRFREFANNAAQQYRSLAEAERQRIQGIRTQFGLYSEEEQHRIRATSQSIAAGRQLTPEEMNTARSHQDIFREFLTSIGNARADAAGIQEILRNVGAIRPQQEAENRAQQLEQTRAQTEQLIQQGIQQGAQANANQIVTQLVPAFTALADALVRRLNQELGRLAADIAMGRQR